MRREITWEAEAFLMKSKRNIWNTHPWKSAKSSSRRSIAHLSAGRRNRKYKAGVYIAIMYMCGESGRKIMSTPKYVDKYHRTRTRMMIILSAATLRYRGKGESEAALKRERQENTPWWCPLVRALGDILEAEFSIIYDEYALPLAEKKRRRTNFRIMTSRGERVWAWGSW